jgi:hypothetical protein
MPNIGKHQYRSNKLGYVATAVQWTGDWEQFKKDLEEIGIPVAECKVLDGPIYRTVQVPAIGATIEDLQDPNWVIFGKRHGRIGINCWVGFVSGKVMTWGKEFFAEIFFDVPRKTAFIEEKKNWKL